MKVSEINTTEMMVTKYEKIQIDKKVADEKIVTSEKVEKDVEVTTKNEPKNKNIEEALAKINKHLEVSNTRIKFQIHDSAHSLNDKVSIKVIDEESEKVIAEIPSEEAIELSERMETIIGFLFDVSK